MSSTVLLAALAFDAAAGEPPAQVHPVVWMGRVLASLERRAPTGPDARLGYGAVVGLGLPLLWGALAWSVERRAPWPARVFLLKSTFAGRALLDAGREVELALAGSSLPAARNALRALVSRPTLELDHSLSAAAAIESLTENLTDSWLAPLLAYAGFGLAGAYAYRAANTADAMWGYRDPIYERLGKAAARLDDVLSWFPARLGGLLLALLSPRPGPALRTWRQDAGRTQSPNAGQTMAAAAGGLDVRLVKPGHYVLNAGGRPPDLEDVAATRRLVGRAMVVAACLALALGRWRRV